MKNYKNASIVTVLAIALFAVVTPLYTFAATINRQLEQGMTGTDVSAVQIFLAKDATLYPQGLVTGYYGTLTKTAVANFQSKNGLPAVGRIGPATLPIINMQMEGGMSGNNVAPTISTVSVNTGPTTANIAWTTNENAKGVVYYSTVPLVTYENATGVDISGLTAITDTTFKTAQNIAINGLQANTTYYYLVYTTDTDGNITVVWPSTFHTSN